MPRTLQNGYPPVSSQDSVIPITQGGTGADNIVQAIANLGGISTDTINAPNGLLRLDEHGWLPTDSLPSLIVTGSTINGPTSLSISQVQTYTITNFSDFLIYNITAITGTVSRSGSVITYTAPGTEGAGGFIINGRVINITILGTKPAAPTITTPVFDATNTGTTLSAASSVFAMIAGTDTHNASDWQIASDSLFTTIITQSLNDTVNKTSWTSGTLLANTTYYIRVRYKGTTYGYGDWSSVTVFNTGTVVNITTEEAIIVNSDATSGDSFGYYVSMDTTGARVAVSAILDDHDGGGPNRGTVYIFRRSGVSWIQEAKIEVTDANDYENAGSSISLNSDGSRIAIGMQNNDVGGTNVGAVEIFSRSGTVWSFESKLQASNKASGDYFGTSVKLSGDASKLVVGSPYSGGGDIGRVYLYTRTGTSWAETTILTPSDGLPDDNFGWFVDITTDGTRIAVGAPNADPSTLTNSGAAYVFKFSGTWTQEIKLTASNKDVSDNFGTSLSINSDGTRLAVGAPLSNPGSINDAGSVYVFFKNGSDVWSEEAILTGSDKAPNDKYGRSVSISNDGSQIAVGASTKIVDGTGRGAVYISKRSGTLWTEAIRFLGTLSPSISNLGLSISLAGDKTRLIAGAPASSIAGVLSGCGIIYK